MCFYHHCDDYSTGREPQYQLTIIKFNDPITCCIVTHFYFMQELCLMKDHWTDFSTSMLCALQNTAFLVSRSDKLNHYTCSLRIKSRKSQAMTMSPWNSVKLGSIQQNDYKMLYNSSLCSDWSSGWSWPLPNISSDTCTMLLLVIYFWCIWTALSCSCLFFLFLENVWMAQTILSSLTVLTIPPWVTIWI